MGALIPIVLFSGFFATLIVSRVLKHRERLAELEIRRLEALNAAGEQAALEADRQGLAKELLEAYDEANRELRD